MIGMLIFCTGMSLLLLAQAYDLDDRVFEWVKEKLK